MKRIAALILLAAAVLLLPMRPAGAEPVSDEAQFLNLLNQLRAEKGVGQLASDGQLVSVARQWSVQLAHDGALSHNPNLPNQVSNWRMLGENVGMGGSVQQLHDAFVNSPHHYENMVEPAFNFVGIGVVEQDGMIYVTVDFKQSSAAAAPAPAPRPAAAPSPAPAARPAAAPRPAPVRVAAAPKPAAPPTTAAPAPGPTTTTEAPPSPEVAGTNFARPDGNGLASHASPSTQLGTEMLALVLLTLVAVRLRRRIKA